MIQLATDPTASRTAHSPVQDGEDGKQEGFRRSRSGHAWPFLSRHTDHPVRPNRQQAPQHSSGS
ncbi:MAG: hypothetical protein ABIR26_03885 [Ramlibacter sp.]